MNKWIVVLGKKPSSGLSIHPHFIKNLKAALELYQSGDYGGIIISGGKTRNNLPSEAISGRNFLLTSLDVDINKVPILLEETSKTTAENINNLGNLLKINHINEITIVASSYHKKRVCLLIKKLFGKESSFKWNIINGFDGLDALEICKEKILYLYYCIDPREKFLPVVFKIIFRNA